MVFQWYSNDLITTYYQFGHWFPLISIDFHWFPLISIDFHWFPLISIDFHWFPLISIDFHWFPLISIDFHWLSTTNQHYQHSNGWWIQVLKFCPRQLKKGVTMWMKSQAEAPRPSSQHSAIICHDLWLLIYHFIPSFWYVYICIYIYIYIYMYNIYNYILYIHIHTHIYNIRIMHHTLHFLNMNYNYFIKMTQD